MQRLGGLLLMLAGVSLGAYTFLPPPIDGKQALSEVTRISAAPDRGVPSNASGSTSAATAPDAAESARSGPAAIAAISKPASTWSAIVTAEQSGQAQVRSLKPGDDGARAQLTRDLQTELKRVGCYGGEVTGNWTPSTRRAMGAFMDRVNATLPTEEPDYILLTLVQGHSEIACGGTCPSGQAMSEGRCVPSAVLARDARKQPREEAVAAANNPSKNDEPRSADEAKAAERAKVAEARRDAERRRIKLADERRRIAAATALAKQKTETSASAETSSAIVAEAGQERLPWLNDDLSAPAGADRGPRPDGMMSIGGPKVEKAEVPAPATVVPAKPAPRFAALTDDVKDAPATVSEPRPSAVGTKAGPAPVRGLPGSKSGVAVRGLPGTKSGPSVVRRPTYAALEQKFDAPFAQPKPKRKSAGLPPAKPKVAYDGGSGRLPKRMLARPGTNSYRMLSAMGGIF